MCTHACAVCECVTVLHKFTLVTKVSKLKHSLLIDSSETPDCSIKNKKIKIKMAADKMTSKLVFYAQ